MKLELSEEDLDLIAGRVVEMLKPLIGGKDREIFDVQGLALYLAVKPEWIYNNRRALPHFKLLGQLRFRRSEIDSWMSKNRVPVG